MEMDVERRTQEVGLGWIIFWNRLARVWSMGVERSFRLGYDFDVQAEQREREGQVIIAKGIQQP
jgi:hypothetical protein